MKQPRLQRDPRCRGDEHLTYRLSGRYQQAAEADVVDVATMRQIAAAVVAAKGNVTLVFPSLDDEIR